MTWKVLSTAPRDGTVIMLARAGGYTEYSARWGIHRNTGEERWVDNHGLGVTGTHWDYPPEAPKARIRFDEEDGA